MRRRMHARSAKIAGSKSAESLAARSFVLPDGRAAPRLALVAVLILTTCGGCATRSWSLRDLAARSESTSPERPVRSSGLVKTSITDDRQFAKQREREGARVVLCSSSTDVPNDASIRAASHSSREESQVMRSSKAEPRVMRSVLRTARVPQRPEIEENRQTSEVTPSENAPRDDTLAKDDPRPPARTATPRVAAAAPAAQVDPLLARVDVQPVEPELLPRDSAPAEDPQALPSGLIEGEDFKPIGAITTRVAPLPASSDADTPDLMPTNYAARAFARHGQAQYRSEPIMPWRAYGAPSVTQNFCHRPLYFEEINVERYGYSAGLMQPAVSAGRFFATIPLLPYKMAVERPTVCRVDGSPYPPGANAPRHRQLPPARVGPALIEAAAIIGMIALIP